MTPRPTSNRSAGTAPPPRTGARFDRWRRWRPRHLPPRSPDVGHHTAPGSLAQGDEKVVTWSDSRIVIAIGRYHVDALAEAYQRYADLVWRTAMAQSGPTVASWVVRDVYLGLWRSPQDYAVGPTSLPLQLCAQARFLAAERCLPANPADRQSQALASLGRISVPTP